MEFQIKYYDKAILSEADQKHIKLLLQTLSVFTAASFSIGAYRKSLIILSISGIYLALIILGFEARKKENNLIKTIFQVLNLLLIFYWSLVLILTLISCFYVMNEKLNFDAHEKLYNFYYQDILIYSVTFFLLFGFEFNLIFISSLNISIMKQIWQVPSNPQLLQNLI